MKRLSKKDQYNKDMFQFVVQLRENFNLPDWDEAYQKASELSYIARKMHRLNECQCNYGLTDRQQRVSDNLDKRALAIAASFGAGAHVELNGDPRGSSIKFNLPNGRHNDWGGSWSVPE